MKITDTKHISQTQKSKKSNKTSSASGASFDSLVEKARAVDTADSVDAVEQISPEGRAPNFAVPSDTEGRSAYLLDVLEELEKDILSGNKSGAISKLKNALNSQALDINDVPETLRHLLAEIELRASLEIAKMEQGQ